ncbi:MAG: glycosyl transferase [Gemmatimonadota bacterium]
MLVHLLSNSRYLVGLTEAGGGFSAWGGMGVTRWRPDRTADADGFFVYLRDLDANTVWSAGFQPTRAHPARYQLDSRPGRVSLTREDQGIETELLVGVDPDADCELRLLTLTNLGRSPRWLEVTTWVEPVLAPRPAHEAHPVFSKLFLETEYSALDQALLVRRRPRSAEDPEAWAAHRLLIEGGGADDVLDFETDRSRFLGRNRTPANPFALEEDNLSKTVGSVLDPVTCFRRRVHLAPNAKAVLLTTLAAGGSRAEIEAAIRKSSTVADGRIALGRSESRARELLDSLAIGQPLESALPRLTGALLCRSAVGAGWPEPGLVPPLGIAVGARFGVGSSALLCAADGRAGADLSVLRAGLAATSFWRRQGLRVDFVARVAPDQADAAHRLIGPLAAETSMGLTLEAGALPEEAWQALGRFADLLLDRNIPLSESPLVVQLPDPEVRPDDAAPVGVLAAAADPPLRFENGYGGFTEDGTEYVIRLPADGRCPPVPWINVIANERAGFLVSEAGAGSTWTLNSRENRLTPWQNDPVSDPHGEALYLRDEETGRYWSPLPGPVRDSGVYEVAHGFGYSRFSHSRDDLEHEVTLFVPPDDPVKITRLTIRNRGSGVRHLAVYSYLEWVLGGVREQTARSIDARIDGGVIFAENRNRGAESGRVAFAVLVSDDGIDVATHTIDREAFLGRYRDPASPLAVERGGALAVPSLHGDPCAASRLTASIAAGASAGFTILLGEAENLTAARALVERYRDPAAGRTALTDVTAFWRTLLGRIQVKTPVSAIDLMMNGWLTYQNSSCRIWARSAFFQSGGAFGFRDQLQDSAALVYLEPARTRDQILVHAAHQFLEGDVLHWWHPPEGKGIRTRFSDDLLWLPYVTAYYVATTGDRAVLDEPIRYLTARLLAEAEDEAYLLPKASGELGSLFEHCCRAIDRSLEVGTHGLPLMGSGDWNDGMNRVGRGGRGESVWLGFFLVHVLDGFVLLCDARGDAERAARYRGATARLRTALDEGGWDGGWYRRAYYDDGTPLGSAQSDECRIDAIAQAWAVISRVASPERAAEALDAAERYLVSDADGIIRLLTPPFDKTPHDPGYIKGYIPGVRENGGQYTHGALWVVRAFAELGRTDRAAELLAMLSPITHATTPDQVARYQVEPYVIAADVYGEPPHVGRGGWTWYTGSAGWMYRVGLESLLGFSVVGGRRIRLEPRLPSSWPGYDITYRVPGSEAVYEIRVRRPADGEIAPSAKVDGGSLPVVDGAVEIPISPESVRHRVEVRWAPEIRAEDRDAR